jgi:hypothetical protein
VLEGNVLSLSYYMTVLFLLLCLTMDTVDVSVNP